MTDIYCLAVQGGIREKLGCLGRAIVSFYRRLERFLVRRADGVIVITARFKEILASWGVNRKDIQVIPVCAPFEEICVGCKDNEWARNVGISRTRNIVYAGTLGTKHNPSLLVALGRHFRDQDDIRLVVITAGPGARYLQRQASQENLNNIILLPFQPFEHLSDILASADILLALLEPDAASYSIPSKVLSQLCSGRPQVISVPEDNVVSQTVKNAGAGIVLPPGNEAKFVEAIAELLADPVSQKRMGDAGRKYVEATLGITALANNCVALMEAIFSARSPVCDNGCSQMPGFTGKSGYPLL
jgi:glycosyltransferase involved in cell wall biosynthesis